ncbi:MAG TPA: ABC transporter permease [Desulfobacteria bacterium]|nr:ABC transporter permease [Desulfobacteria bacterium]
MTYGSRLIKKSAEMIIAMLIIIGFWYFLAVFIKNQMLPTPWEAVTEFFRIFSSTIWVHFYISAYRVVVSLLVSFAAAVPLGLLIGREKIMDRFISPVIYLVYPIPKIVFLPIVFLFFGLGDFPKVFMISLIVAFQILVTARDAAKSVPPQSIYSMTSLGANRWQVYYHVIWPSCLPKVLTSLRISLGTAIAVLFFVETFATTEGLGYFIMDSWSRSEYSEMFAGIIGMSILGLLLYIIIDIVDSRWCKWQNL